MTDKRIFLSPHGVVRLKEHEGCVLHVYRCSAGFRTFGYGHNIDANPLLDHQKELMCDDPLALANALFERDVDIYAQCVQNRIPWVADMGQPRIDVNINLAFNMGCKKWVHGWPNTISLIRRRLYSQAAQVIRNSKYRQQVGNRALELANQLETGEFQDSHVLSSAGRPSIIALQNALNQHEAYPRLEVTGIAGPAIYRAIQDFQRSNGLTIDGIAGRRTLSLLGLT